MKIPAFAAMVCLGATPLCGCSFIFVSGPPAHVERIPPSRPVECTSSKAAPIIDTLVAGYEVFRTGYALSADDSAYVNSPIKRAPDIALGAMFTALFVGAATYGYIVTGRCSEAKEAFLRMPLMPDPVNAAPEGAGPFATPGPQGPGSSGGPAVSPIPPAASPLPSTAPPTAPSAPSAIPPVPSDTTPGNAR